MKKGGKNNKNSKKDMNVTSQDILAFLEPMTEFDSLHCATSMVDIITNQSVKHIEEIMAQEKLPAYNVEYTLVMTQYIQKLTEIVYDDRFDDQYLDVAVENVSSNYSCLISGVQEPAKFDIHLSDMLPVVKVPSVHDHLVKISSSGAMPKTKKRSKNSPRDKDKRHRPKRTDSSMSKDSCSSIRSKVSMAGSFKRSVNMRESSIKSSSPDSKNKSLFGKSFMNKTGGDFQNKSAKQELIEPPKKLGNYKQKM